MAQIFVSTWLKYSLTFTAYRWFCGFELNDTIPDHSTFSKTRVRKWQKSDIFQKVFYEIIRKCIADGLIDGEAMVADGSYIPASVSRGSWIDVEIEVQKSMQSYLDALDEELSNQPGFKKPPAKKVKKRRTTSQTDPDSGYINHGSKRGVGYLMEATVDCKHGILTGVDVYPANQKENLLVLRHLERQINLGIPMNRLALDRGYETGAVHRGSCWALPDSSLRSNFPIHPKNTDSPTIHSRMRSAVRKESLLHITG